MNERLANLVFALIAVLSAFGAIRYFADSHVQGNTIRLAHDSKESSPLHRALMAFEQRVESDSRGEIQVELYPGAQLGGVRETTEMVRQGNLQMTAGASVLLTSIVPEFNVLDIFYLFRDAAHAHRALDHPDVGGLLLDAMASKGLKGLGYMEVGFRSITSSKRPITALADIEGLKIRAAANPIQIDAWRALGAAPTPLSWGEIFTSLQQGLINTQESAVYSVYASIARQRLLSAEQNRQIVADLERQGMQVNRVDAAVRAAMKARMNRAVSEAIREKTGRALFDAVMQKIEQLAAQAPAQSAI